MKNIYSDFQITINQILIKLSKISFLSINLDTVTIHKKKFLGICVHALNSHYLIEFVRLSGQSINADFLSQLIEISLKDLKLFNKIKICVTDGDSTLKKSISMIGKGWVYCLSHFFNLIIGEVFESIPEIIKILSINNVLYNNSSFRCFMLNCHPKEHFLKEYVKTRWTSSADSICRLKEISSFIEHFQNKENSEFLTKEDFLLVSKSVNLCESIQLSFLQMNQNYSKRIFNSFQCICLFSEILKKDIQNHQITDFEIIQRGIIKRLEKYFTTHTSFTILAAILNINFDFNLIPHYLQHLISYERVKLMIYSTANIFSVRADQIIIEISDFLNVNFRHNYLLEDLDSFWLNNHNQYPTLYKIFDIFRVTPMNSNNIENYFSQITSVYTKKRYNLTDEKIRCLSILYCNNTVLSEIIQNIQYQMNGH